MAVDMVVTGAADASVEPWSALIVGVAAMSAPAVANAAPVMATWRVRLVMCEFPPVAFAARCSELKFV
jgi:hypothetical protein